MGLCDLCRGKEILTGGGGGVGQQVQRLSEKETEYLLNFRKVCFKKAVGMRRLEKLPGSAQG